jgi:hypothetical protein
VTFHWAARAIDLWLAAVGGLRFLWQRVPGDLLGYMVMRGSGIGQPNRIVQLDDVTALVVEDARVGRYFDSGWMAISAQTVGRYVFCRQTIDRRTLIHESEHIRQWRRFGPVYLPLYFGSSLVALLRGRHPYDDNVFEIAARRRAERET